MFRFFLWGRLVFKLWGLLIVLALGLMTVMLLIGPLLPSGGQIAFMSDRRDPGMCGDWDPQQCDIYIMDINRRLSVPITHTLGNERYPSWSPDGERIAYHANPNAPYYDLYMMNADGGDTQLLNIANEEEIFDEAMVTWSPDGRRIIFHSGIRGSDDFHLYVGDLETNNYYRILNGAGDSIHADISPDGSKVAFVSDRVSPELSYSEAIYVLDVTADFTNPAVNESLLRRLTDDYDSTSRAYFPSWSPDGSQIVYVVYDSVQGSAENIYIIDVDGTNPRNITRMGTYASTHPDWLPDGRIMFASNRDGDYDIYVMNPDGTGVEQITNEPGNEMAPDWRP